jgi:hypothetical protein
MSTARTIICTLAAALCALGLSVGAALAEGTSTTTAKDGKRTPAGVCFLHDIVP